jgi:hypothetical protein
MVLVLALVGGGFTGVAATLGALLSPEFEGFGANFAGILFVGVYGFVTGAGLAFVHDPRCRLPVYAALGLQVPWFATPLLSYKMSAGLGIDLGWWASNVHLGWDLGARWSFSVFQVGQVGIGVNIVAIALLELLVLADRADDRLRREKLAFGGDGDGQG